MHILIHRGRGKIFRQYFSMCSWNWMPFVLQVLEGKWKICSVHLSELFNRKLPKLYEEKNNFNFGKLVKLKLFRFTSTKRRKYIASGQEIPLHILMFILFFFKIEPIKGWIFQIGLAACFQSFHLSLKLILLSHY